VSQKLHDLAEIPTLSPEIDDICSLALDQILLLPGFWLTAAYLRPRNTSNELFLAHCKQRQPYDLPLRILTHGTLDGSSARQFLMDTLDSKLSNNTLAVPLVVTETQCVGILLAVASNLESIQPDDLSYRLVDAIARQTALAVHHAHILADERRQHRISETLRAAVSATSAIQNYEALLQVLLQHLRQILPYDSADVYLTTIGTALEHRATLDTLSEHDSHFTTYYRQIEPVLYPALRDLLDNSEPLIFHDVHPDDRPIAPGVPPSRSLMLLSMSQRGQVLGVLAVRSHQERAFDHESLLLAAAFADQIARATANARLFTIKQEQLGRVKLLEEVSTLFSGTLTVAEGLDQILTELSSVLDYDSASVMLIESEMLHMVAWRSKYIQEPFVQVVPISVLKGANRVYQSRAPVLVNDTRSFAEGWADIGNRDQGLLVKSWIGAPLLVRGEVIGVLNVDSVTAYRFNPDDVKVVQGLATRLSIAVENEHLLRELTQRNQTLQILNQVIVAANRSLALEPLMNTVLEQVLAALKVKAGSIHLAEPNSDQLKLRVSVGLDDELRSALEVIRSSDPLPLAVNGQSFFTIPFIVKDSLLGILNLLDRPEQPVNQYDSALLLSLGDQIAVTLENARLYEAALENAHRSTELRKLGLAITGTLNHQEVLELVARESASTFGVESVYIWLREGDEVVGSHYYDVHGRDRSFFIGFRVAINNARTLGAYLVNQRTPLYFNQAPNATGPLNKDLVARLDALSLMGVPLVKGNQALGSIVLISTSDPDHFNDDYLEQLSLLGVQVALALDNATLFAETRHRLAQLRLVNDMGRYATGILLFEPLIESVTQQLYAVLKYETITLYLVENNHITVRFALAEGVKIPPKALPKGYLPLVGTVGRVVKSGEPILVRDISQEVRVEAVEARSEMVVPLILGHEVIGAISVERAGPNSINQEDLDVMQPLAAHLANSIANAQLFEKVAQHNAELELRVDQRTAEIRRQQERIEAIVTSVADAIIVTDLTGQMVLANPVATALFDAEPTPEDERPKLSLVVQRLSQQPERESEEMVEFGAATFQAKASKVMENEQAVGTVIVLRDITRLQEVDRLKSDFVSQVSHELRTPMSNIKLYLSLLKRGKTEKYDSYMEIIEAEAQRLERLISNLLDISRIDYARRTAGDEHLASREMLDVNELIQQVITNHAPQARLRQITLQQHLTPDLPAIFANRDQIIQVLTNLLGNAIVYTGEGGSVAARSYLESEWIVMEVSDTGVGIAEEDQAHIFERFYRGSTPDNLNPPGTGLGLAITKEIVELHRGHITVTSQVGAGSVFHVYLPATITSANGI
jgi:signal transduction histidine kinase/uncharacterized protein YigA (DUF484 family)